MAEPNQLPPELQQELMKQLKAMQEEVAKFANEGIDAIQKHLQASTLSFTENQIVQISQKVANILRQDLERIEERITAPQAVTRERPAQHSHAERGNDHHPSNNQVFDDELRGKESPVPPWREKFIDWQPWLKLLPCLILFMIMTSIVVWRDTILAPFFHAKNDAETNQSTTKTTDTPSVQVGVSTQGRENEQNPNVNPTASADKNANVNIDDNGNDEVIADTHKDQSTKKDTTTDKKEKQSKSTKSNKKKQ